MKNFLFFRVFVFLLLLVSFTSCEIVGGIFEAGVWVGMIIVVLVLAGIFWLIRKFMS